MPSSVNSVTKKSGLIANKRPDFDKVIIDIAQYALMEDHHFSELAYQTAYHCFIDSIGCALMSLKYSACTKLLGPYIPGTDLANGCPILGLSTHLDPIQAAFNLGAMIRWLDFNDTWLAAEWGHPSDNLGAILALSDYLDRNNIHSINIRDILTCMIIAYEIQGVLALENSFNAVGMDHVILVKIASTAVSCRLLTLSFEQTCNAISHAWLDGQSLRTYRHAPNTGSRKSWAAGDATSRAIRLAWLAQQNEMGYPSAITAPIWGFQDSVFRGQTIKLKQPLQNYVMENILWKISFPAEFHAQTAVECALLIHPQIKDRINEIASIEVQTQEAAMRIINKTGPLHNPADRDHCLQYMIAIGLLYGDLNAEHYEDDIASNPDIDLLRSKMKLVEDTTFSKDYMDSNKRSIANRIKINFNDGTSTDPITVEYPIGHQRRRKEGVPLLINKFNQAIRNHYNETQGQKVLDLCLNYDSLCSTPISIFHEELKVDQK
jgi:2-methylcitrate dehydratase